MVESEDIANLQDLEDDESNDVTQAVDVTEVIRVETMTEETMVAPKGRGKRRAKFQGLLAARDFRFLVWYIVTEKCRRIPWDLFFENAKKGLILYRKSSFPTDGFRL